MMFALFTVALLSLQKLAAVSSGNVSLKAVNFTFDGAHQICPNEVVNFTCMGTNLMAQRWEWSRSIDGNEETQVTDIMTLFRDSPPGPVTLADNSIFTAYLREVIVSDSDLETSLANFSSSLHVNLSVLDNGNDVFTCRDSRPAIRSSILVSYIPIGKIIMNKNYIMSL